MKYDDDGAQQCPMKCDDDVRRRRWCKVSQRRAKTTYDVWLQWCGMRMYTNAQRRNMTKMKQDVD